MEIHPLADLFPMMPDDELAQLAEDIRLNGLRFPIVVGKWPDDEGFEHHGIIDGRNRMKACELAGVEPQFQELNGQDARAFIASANLARRNLTAGQQAMAMAMLYPDPEKGGRGKKSLNPTETLGFSRMRLSQARQILREAPTLAPSVLAGALSLDQALTKLNERKKLDGSPEEQMKRLSREAPDLHKKALEGMNPGEAIAALMEREKQKGIARENARRAAQDLPSFASSVAIIATGYQLGERGLLVAKHLEDLRSAFDALTSLFEEYER